MYLNNLPELKIFRRKLRHNLTPAEAKLWTMLKGAQLQGRKFRRQHSFGGYLLDFYCPSEKLGIELDGEVHYNEQALQYDYERTLFMEYFDIKILRFENARVFDSSRWLIARIESSFGWNKGLEKNKWIDG